MKKVFLALSFFILALNFAKAEESIPYANNEQNKVTIVTEEENKDNLKYKVTEKVDIAQYSAPTCADVPLVFTECIPSLCIEKTPLGNVFKEIKGADKEKKVCIYKERTRGFGGLGCDFENAVLGQVELLYTKKSLSIIDPSKKLTTQEVENLRILNEKSCKALTDLELQEPLPLDTSQATLEQTEKQKKAEQAPTKEEPKISSELQSLDKKESNPETPVVVDVFNNPQDAQFKSVMFTDQELNLIDESLNAFKKGTGIAGAGLGVVIENEITRYQLNSIIYKGLNQWIIWINNQKYSNETKDGALEIQDVSPLSATIKWQTGDLDRLSPDWRRKLLYVNNNRYKAKVEDGLIIVEAGEQNAAVIVFKLQPNQTFNVNEMKIIEGSKG